MSTLVARASQPGFAPPLSRVAEIEAGITTAEHARREAIDTYSTDRIVTALARAAADWLDPAEPLRLLAIGEVARTTGFDRNMVATGIDFIFSAVTAEGLQRVARAEASRSESAPRAVFYSLAGNVPGQGVPAIARALLARSIAILRDSERQPVITAAFRETLGRYEPTLAAMVVPVVWSHRASDRAVERIAVAAAERVELYGADRTLHDLSARYRSFGAAGCALHGARVSAGLAPAGADLALAARGFAVDVAMYEGRGCLTPHVILVEGDAARATAFADALTHELAACQARWPRAHGSAEEERDRRRFIDDAELRALAGATDCGRVDRCLVGPSSTWCVHQSAEVKITIGPGVRCVRVAAVADRAATLAALSAAESPLAAVGVACSAPPAGASGIDDRSLAAALRAAGATLVCAAGRMQAPPIDWRQDSGSGDAGDGPR